MPASVHFISGLPRSGSTLLSALLRQNPRIAASVTSPVVSFVNALMPKVGGANEFSSFLDDARRRMVLRGLFDSYYSDIPPEHVVFDTNRLWTGKAALLHELYPDARIICCVRDVGWVIDSVERMLRKNPLRLSKMVTVPPGSSIYGRAEAWMNSENGFIGQPWSSLREAWFGEHANKLLVIPYDKLASEPQSVLKRLYEELHEPPFPHDIDHVRYDTPEYDQIIGLPGLHNVREKVRFEKREPCIPPDILAKYADTNFWLKPALNRGVTIL